MLCRLRDILLAMIALTVIFLGACNNDGCEQNSSSLPLAGFYSSATKKSIAIDSLTVYGINAPGDSAIMRCYSASQVYLPLDIDSQTTRFVIRYEQGDLQQYNITDTISINYKARPYFHSEECGAMYVYDVSGCSTTHYLIDSISALPLIDTTDRQNIFIYFRTGEAEEQ